MFYKYRKKRYFNSAFIFVFDILLFVLLHHMELFFLSVIKTTKISLNFFSSAKGTLYTFCLIAYEAVLQFMFPGDGFLSPFTSTRVAHGGFVVWFGFFASPQLPQSPQGVRFAPLLVIPVAVEIVAKQALTLDSCNYNEYGN